MRLGLRLLPLLALLLTALAARPARVDIENAEIYEGPGRSFKLLEKLPKGTALAVSNVPSEGFFKVRTPSGIVGWISADSLLLADPDKPEQVVVGEVNTGTPGPSPGQPFRGPARKYMRLRALGGLNLFSVSEVNSLFSFDGMKNGIHYGGEIVLLFQSDLSILLRVEQVVKNVVATDTQTSKTFQLDLNSTPAMLGIELDVNKEGRLTTQFAVMAGLALHTNLTSTALNITEPNTTELEDHAFTGLAKVNLNWQFTKTVGIFGEAGYRLLKTKSVYPGRAGNGSDIFAVSGAFVPLAFDLSGMVVGGGIVINL